VPQGQRRVVQAGQQRSAAGRRLAQEPERQVGQRRVQGRRRFVGQHQVRPLDQQPGQGDPLPLATGEPVGALEHPVGQAHPLQRRPHVLQSGRADQRPRRPRRRPGAEAPGVHVVHHPQRPRELEVLVHRAGPRPQLPQRPPAQRRGVRPEHPHRTGRREHRPVEDAEQRGLARSRRADDRDPLTRGHGEVHLVQGHGAAEADLDAGEPGDLGQLINPRSRPISSIRS
jgi:hypothetical protein